MYRQTLIVFISLFIFSTYCVHVEDTELVMTFLIHRHGDRTPLKHQIYLSNDVNSLTKLSERYGYGQLTNVGKQRSYKVGGFIRRRYNQLLSPRYNSSEIYIRSTLTDRSMMTVLVAMAAVYSADDDRWSSTINWTPVPYETLPMKYDHLMAMISCPKFTKITENVFNADIPSMNKYKYVLEKLSKGQAYNITGKPLQSYVVYDMYLSQLSMGLPLSPIQRDLFPALQEAAEAALEFVFGDEENKIYQTGVLLHDFFRAASSVISGSETRRVWIFSAHDLNVFAMLGVSKVVPKPKFVKYGGIFALELRKDLKTGIHYILPVYVSSPEQPEEYLRVDGCDHILCNYDTFKKITSKYALDYKAWQTKCEYVDNKDEPYDEEYMKID